MIQLNGESIATVAEFAESKGRTAQTMYKRVTKYRADGGTLESVYSVGNMDFFRVADLDVVYSAYESESKKDPRDSKRKTVPVMDYLHVEALLEDTERTMKFLRDRVDSAEDDSNWLAALESAGVDNWSGYDYARKIYSGEEEH